MTSIVGAFVGAFLSVWFALYLRRPKLRVTATSQVSDLHGSLGTARISSRPGMLGLRLTETVVFRQRLHRAFVRGLAIEREPAKECLAALCDKRTGKQVSAFLWWRPSVQEARWELSATIAPGASAELALLGQRAGESTKYFVFRPAVEADLASPPVVPAETEFDEPRDFRVCVFYGYGGQRLWFDLFTWMGPNGRLHWEIPKQGATAF